MIATRSMNHSDIARGLALCRASGWNQLQRDWELFLRLGPRDCRVAMLDDEVRGTIAVLRYQKYFSWIGMVLVDPDYRQRGIGLQLLREALEILKEEETIKLDATPQGRELYLKLNFVDEYPIYRMKTIADANKVEIIAARSMHKSDIPQVAAFDQVIFGADREPLLTWMIAGAPEYAFVVKNNREIQGYCFGRPGHNFIHLGPVIAKNFTIAKDVLSAALSKCDGKSVVVDSLHGDSAWMNWLKHIGFAELRSFTRMYRGTNRFCGVPQNQFAIMGPEFG
jgi:GNAT superfamily N-acetyltransferase